VVFAFTQPEEHCSNPGQWCLSGLKEQIMFKIIVSIGVVLLGFLFQQQVSAQDFSANIGWNSEYIYRGIPQKTSSAFGGLGLTAGEFYLSGWVADVGVGVEIDYCTGYTFEVGDFGFGVGATYYTYSEDFDDTYLEANLSVSWKWLSFDTAFGEYENFARPVQQYQFYSLTVAHNGFYGKFGFFEDDFDGEYYEAGYGNTLSVSDTDLFDYRFSVVHSNDVLLGGESDTNLVLSLTKAFDF
jgi:hypothetical protein